MTHRVFSYGTLAEKFPQATDDAFLEDYYRLGNYGQYPALIKDSLIHKTPGKILILTDDQFAEADRYEDYPLLYSRKKLSVDTDFGSVEAWVYILKEGDANE